MIPLGSLLRAIAFTSLYFVLRRSFTDIVSVSWVAKSAIFFPRWDIHPAIPFFGLVLFSSNTLRQIRRVAEHSRTLVKDIDVDDQLHRHPRLVPYVFYIWKVVGFFLRKIFLVTGSFSSKNWQSLQNTRRVAIIIGSVSLLLFLISVASGAMPNTEWNQNIFGVLIVYFAQFIILDISFFMFAVGIFTATGKTIPFLVEFVLQFLGIIMGLGITFLAVVSQFYPSIKTWWLGLCILVVVVIEIIYRYIRFIQNYQLLNRALWVFRISLLFSLLVNSMFIFVPIYQH